MSLNILKEWITEHHNFYIHWGYSDRVYLCALLKLHGTIDLLCLLTFAAIDRAFKSGDLNFNL